MARTGKKIILLQIHTVDDLEDVIEFAQKKGDSAGLRITLEYFHDVGLKLNVSGPRDKINLYEYQLREYVKELEETEEFDDDSEE